MTARRSFFHTLTLGLFAAPVLALTPARAKAKPPNGHRVVQLNGLTLAPEDYEYHGDGWISFNFRLKGGTNPDIITIPFVSGGHVRSVVYKVPKDLPMNIITKIFDPADLPADY